MRPPRIPPLFLLALLAGCAVGPDYQAPEPQPPASWSALNDATSDEPARLRDWWHRLGDPELDRLVDRAIDANLDLRLAVARLDEARARRAAAAGGRWPTLDASADYSRSARSARTDFGDFGVLRDVDLVRVGLDAAWEIDLWGRVRRGVEAADAELDAAVADRQQSLVTVVAEVVLEYLDLRAAQQRLAIAQQNLRLQDQTRQLVEARVQAGLASQRQLAQAESNVATTKSRLPELQSLARAAQNRLAVLLGVPPGSLAGELGTPAPIPTAPLEVAVGVPADALRHRPDVRAAERRLAAATARTGETEADLYPRLSLLGSLGLEAKRPADLFRPAASVFSFGPALAWNVFDGGTRRATVAAAGARAEQALVSWQSTVLVALEEVENALDAFVRNQARRQSLADAVAGAEQARRLVETEYRQGLVDFQVVLDAERELAARTDELVLGKLAVTREFAALFKALGGGWQHAEPPADG